MALMDPKCISYTQYKKNIADLFDEALKEAKEQNPSSPAISLGEVVLNKLNSDTSIPKAIMIRSAKLLIPLCGSKEKMLREFIKTSAI